MSAAIEDIAAERKRQIEVEGWTPEHDDENVKRELARAAGCYVWVASLSVPWPHHLVPDHWPWLKKYWKPKDPRRNLVKAAALIVAEIERLDRLPEVEAKAFAWTDTTPSR